MTNEVLFAGGRLDSVAAYTGSPVDVTTSGYFDSSYADAGISVGAGGDTEAFVHRLYTQSGGVLSPDDITSGETLHLHFEVAFQSNQSSVATGVSLRDSSDFPWVRLRRNTTVGNVHLFYNSGTGASPVWTQLGANIPLTATTRYTFDIELTIGSPHAIKLYLNGSLLINTTFTQASLTAIDRVTYANLARPNATPWCVYSQILATRGILTVGAKVQTSRATGAGANTGWTNTHTNVNEAVGNDATFQSAGTDGLKSTHAMGDVTVASGFEVRSVFHWLRAKNDGSAPANIKSVLGLSGTDYATANLSGIGVGYGPVGARYDLDPLGSNWTQTTWNAIEAGYEAAT